MSVHLPHIRSYRPRQSALAPDFRKLEKLFLGKTLPTPALEEYVTFPTHVKLLMLSITGVDKGYIVPIIIYIVYGSKASAQKLTSNTELTRSYNVKNVLQHTALNISLRKSRLLLATSESISLRNTVIPSEAISNRKTVVPSKANPLFASSNPDLA